MNRFKNNLYTIEDIVFRNHQHVYIRNEDGALFSGRYKTKIQPEDLPEWYVYGRFYKRFGYMSTKGITDMLYVPNRFSNHYLKDDALYISFGGKIQQSDPTGNRSIHERLSGFDERVWGNEILTILKGARKYSNYDIAGFIQQLKEKKEWLISSFPEEFGHGKWDFDIDAYFDSPLPERSITRSNENGGN